MQCVGRFGYIRSSSSSSEQRRKRRCHKPTNTHTQTQHEDDDVANANTSYSGDQSRYSIDDDNGQVGCMWSWREREIERETRGWVWWGDMLVSLACMAQTRPKGTEIFTSHIRAGRKKRISCVLYNFYRVFDVWWMHVLFYDFYVYLTHLSLLLIMYCICICNTFIKCLWKIDNIILCFSEVWTFRSLPFYRTSFIAVKYYWAIFCCLFILSTYTCLSFLSACVCMFSSYLSKRNSTKRGDRTCGSFASNTYKTCQQKHTTRHTNTVETCQPPPQHFASRQRTQLYPEILCTLKYIHIFFCIFPRNQHTTTRPPSSCLHVNAETPYIRWCLHIFCVFLLDVGVMVLLLPPTAAPAAHQKYYISTNALHLLGTHVQICYVYIHTYT